MNPEELFEKWARENDDPDAPYVSEHNKRKAAYLAAYTTATENAARVVKEELESREYYESAREIAALIMGEK